MAVDVLVTGASGVLGQRVVHILRSSGYEVVACGRKRGPGMDAVWDISQQDGPEPPTTADIVVHAAARTGCYGHPVSDAVSLFQTNVVGTVRVANLCASRKVRKLVMISGAIVYGQWTGTPKTESDPVAPSLAGPYAVSKWCGEQVAHMVTETGCQLAVLRLSSLYGTGYNKGLMPKLIREGAEKGRVILEPPFEDAFDLLHVSDAARTVAHAVEFGHGGLWNVGGGRLTTVREMAEICASVTGAELVLADSTPARPARIINWVDDRRARKQLEHENIFALERGVEEIETMLCERYSPAGAQ